MTKAPDPDRLEDSPQPVTAGQGEGVTVAQPGPDEPSVTSPVEGPIPNPAAFTFPEPVKLTKGQITGLCTEGIEAYLFGQRTRYDAGGRVWEMRREAVDDIWCLTIRVSLGNYLLAEAALPLDRLPSADGEHQLIELIEAMAGRIHERQHEVVAEQKKLAKEAEAAAKEEAEAAHKAAAAETREAHKHAPKEAEQDYREGAIRRERQEAQAEHDQATPVEKAEGHRPEPETPHDAAKKRDEKPEPKK